MRIIRSRRMRWERHADGIGDKNIYRILVGKPEGKRQPGRFGRRWEDNVMMDLREMGLVWLRIGTSRGLL
jgi:hypothetical protein